MKDRKEYFKKYYRLNRSRKLEQSNKRYRKNRYPPSRLHRMEQAQVRILTRLEERNKKILRKKFISLLKKRLSKLKRREHEREWHRHHYRNSVQRRLGIGLRSRLNTALKSSVGVASAVKLLGCTIPEFIAYIEGKFESGMSWDNHSKHGWHLDHIRPLASFDLTDPEQLKEACHYTNYQPLWAIHNWRKNARLDWTSVIL